MGGSQMPDERKSRLVGGQDGTYAQASRRVERQAVAWRGKLASDEPACRRAGG